MGCKNSLDLAFTDQRGSVLIGGLLLVLAMTLIGVGLFEAAMIETGQVAYTERDVRAFYAADTGLNRASGDLASNDVGVANSTFTDVKNALNANTTVPQFFGSTSTCFRGSSCDSAHNPKTPAYIVQATNHADADKFWLTSTACIPGPAANPCPAGTWAAAQIKSLIVQTTITVTIPGTPETITTTTTTAIGMANAIFGASTTTNPAVKISGDGLVDSFDSRGCPTPPCAYDPASARTNGDIQANGAIDVKATVKGDILNDVNVSGTDVKLESGTTVTGTVKSGGTVSNNAGVPASQITQNSGTTPPSLTPLSNCGPYPSSMSSAITQYDGSGKVVTDPSKLKWAYNSSTGALNISTGSPSTGWVSIAPGNYCLGSIVASGGSLIKVTGLTELTSNGQVNLSGGTFANTTNDSQNLQIISTYGNDPGETSTNNFVVSGGSGAYMVLWAPTTKVTISGSGDIFGTVVGNVVEASGGSQVHFDEFLASGAATLAPGIGFQLTITTTTTTASTPPTTSTISGPYELQSWRQSNCRQTSPSSPWTCS